MPQTEWIGKSPVRVRTRAAESHIGQRVSFVKLPGGEYNYSSGWSSVVRMAKWLAGSRVDFATEESGLLTALCGVRQRANCRAVSRERCAVATESFGFCRKPGRDAFAHKSRTQDRRINVLCKTAVGWRVSRRRRGCRQGREV